MTDIDEVRVEDEKPTQVRFAPLALSKAPQVAALLERLDLGSLIEGEISAYVGRNDNWSGVTTTGACVFIKKIGGSSFAEAKQRYDRVLSFEALRARHGDESIMGPRLYGADADALLLAYELLPDARSGAELAADDRFGRDLCERAGAVTAVLHNLPPDQSLVDTSEHPLPPKRLNDVDLGAFIAASSGELEIWRLVQGDQQLRAVLSELRAADLAYRDRRVVHADLRLDQFLWSGDQLFLIDWEELRLGDPARDVGSFLGEWLYQAVHGIPKAVAAANGFLFGYEASHDEIIRLGVQELDRVRPMMAAFWKGYCATRSDCLDEGFQARAARFAGWHLLDRLFATAIVGGRVPASDRASAGIGRTILLSPQNFTDILGMGNE